MRERREADTFQEILGAFGEEALFSIPDDDDGNPRDPIPLQVVGTHINREALDILDGDTVALLNDAGRTLGMTQNTWMIELSEKALADSEASIKSTITFRNKNYKSAGDMLTDVGTKKIILKGT